MKRHLLLYACLLAAVTATAASRTATEAYVTNRVTQATNALHEAIAPSIDYSTNNNELVETIKETAPAPGNYAAVSNAAMSAASSDSVLPASREPTSPDWYVDAPTRFTGVMSFDTQYVYFHDGFYFSGGESYRLSDNGVETPGGFAWWPEGYGRIALTNDIPSIPSTNGFFRVDRDVEYNDYWRLYGVMKDDGAYKWTLGFPNDAVNVFYWLPSFTEGSSDTQIPGEGGYDVYLASRGYVQQQVGLKASSSDITAAITPVSNKVETTSAIVDSWEGYWGATNVELRVTNYYGNTTGALPRLQIREHRDGHWTNVWDEIDKFIACKAEILHEVAQSNATLLAEADRKYAPKAWGSHTDKGTTNVIPNSVYMTSPETYFGGGTEFQRVAVGSGAVSVLVDRGALAKTTGEPGTFRFQDAGGTNYFGFVKSDSYTIGCRTDGISVGAGNAITLRYDVIMSGEDVPVVYWKQQLESATPWAQLNNPDGTAADGAPYAVTWLQDGGSYSATVNCGGSPSGFFVAETSVAGDVVWETNMKARLGGGIECTNTATHVNGVIRAKYNGSTVTWEWSAR